jgi:hypothetical protein
MLTQKLEKDLPLSNWAACTLTISLLMSLYRARDWVAWVGTCLAIHASAFYSLRKSISPSDMQWEDRW